MAVLYDPHEWKPGEIITSQRLNYMERGIQAVGKIASEIVPIPGPPGEDGEDGKDGKNATINGRNVIQIVAGENISLDESIPGILKISATGGGGGTEPVGTPISEIPVGSIIKINENGTPVEYLVVHQGLPSSMYDASCNGTWALRKDIKELGVLDADNSNVLPGADIFTVMANYIIQFDPAIQAAIQTVKIPYCVGGGSSTVKSGADGLECKIFPLSGYEVGWTTKTDERFPVDGYVLNYFQGTSSGAEQKRVSYFNGEAKGWFTRSAYTPESGSVWVVLENENYQSQGTVLTYGLRPAFVLSPDLTVSDDGTVIADLPEKKPLNEMSWADIGKVARAGVASEYFQVGDTKTITLNGQVGKGLTLDNLQIDVFLLDNKPHNPDIEGNDKLHFQLGKISGKLVGLVDSKYNTTVSETGYFSMNAANANAGGWDGSQMKANILVGNGTPSSPVTDTLLAALPADLRAVMVGCTKYTDNVGGGTSVFGNVTKTQEYICLLDEFEISGSSVYGNTESQNYQKQYEYYKSGNSKIHYKHSDNYAEAISWTRGVQKNVGTNFCSIKTNGDIASDGSGWSESISPIFFVG